MSGIFGETLTFTQAEGNPIRLVAFGDEKYVRYETVDGFTTVYDEAAGGYCFAEPRAGALVSSGERVDGGDPSAGIVRHLRDRAEIRDDRVRARHRAMIPTDMLRGDRDSLLTFGPSGGLLPGRRLDAGVVRGLTILVDFPDTRAQVTPAEVDALLNSPDYREHGNVCSVNEYFATMSTGRLDFANTVVGPFTLSRPRLAYASETQRGLLVPEAIEAAVDAGVDLADFDSLGEGIVDSLCIMYAGRTEYRGDLWPHNWVHRATFGGVRTELYIVTSMGRTAADLSIGTFCHESGHLLCRWPDLYDYGPLGNEGDLIKSAGVGGFCVMGSGNHLDSGRTPAPVCSYLRDLVGWCGTDVDLAVGGQFESRHGDYDTALRYPTGMVHEYFMVENRTRAGFDLHSPASGLAVFHCDTRGSNEFQQGTRSQHYQVALLQADGHLDLESNLNTGDGGDLYGQVAGTALSHASMPSSRLWSGVDSGLTLSEVGAPGPVIGFRVGAVDGGGGIGGSGGEVVEGTSSPGLFIPDARPGGVSDVITIVGAGTVRSISVAVEVSHTYIGDLRVELFSPTGRRVLLHNMTGGSVDDLHLAVDSQTSSALSPLVGQPVAGQWQLRVSDTVRIDTGTLDSWQLEITTGT